jgi:hypothetical protein
MAPEAAEEAISEALSEGISEEPLNNGGFFVSLRGVRRNQSTLYIEEFCFFDFGFLL